MLVGIAADDGLHSRDLAPVPWDGSADARGLPYGAFVAKTVVAAVDRAYRTIATPRCRGVGGASLGGVSALQIVLNYPGTFDMAFALSPLLRDPAIAGFVARLWRDRGSGPHVLIDLDDDATGHADRQWLESVVQASPPATVVQSPGGGHTIASWAERPGAANAARGALRRLSCRRHRASRRCDEAHWAVETGSTSPSAPAAAAVSSSSSSRTSAQSSDVCLAPLS